jgi:hypothetical protein
MRERPEAGVSKRSIEDRRYTAAVLLAHNPRAINALVAGIPVRRDLLRPEKLRLLGERLEGPDYVLTEEAAIRLDVGSVDGSEPDSPEVTRASESVGSVAEADLVITSTPATEITMRSIRWLEKPLWQNSAFQLFAGEKGAGKGTYLAGLAARRSRDGKAALFISSEDSAEIDIVPRLAAAQAELALVRVVDQHIRLPDDIGRLREHAATIDNLGLIVIDPVANHIGNRNSNADAEVRHAIAPLNKLADELGCLIVGVRHPGKDRSRGALISILGSTAWVDTPRAVVMAAKDDVDKDVRHIQVVAGNRARNGNALSFRIEEARVAGLDEPVTLAVELGESCKSVDALLSEHEGKNTRTGEARELVLDILSFEGDQESDALDARVAGETGLAAQTVKNVRKELVGDGLIKAYPDKDETGAIVRWNVGRTQAPRS